MNALVMYDHQTDSLWSHFTGDAIVGPLAGTKLEILPALQTTWERWRGLHPDTLVLDKGAGEYRDDSYDSYYESDDAGSIGETREDNRLLRKEFVLGLVVNGEAKAYAFPDLKDHPVVNGSVGGKDVVVTFDPESATGGTFSRNVAGRTLTFLPFESTDSNMPLMVDRETGSQWLLHTGEAIGGTLKGTKLEALNSNYAFWFAWKDWYPYTKLFLRDDFPS